MTTAFVFAIIVLSIYFLSKTKNKSTFIESNQKNKKSNQQDEELVNISSKTAKNSVTFSVEINEKELAKRLKDGTIRQNKEKTIEDIAGFYGSEEYSINKEYCVIYCDGYYDNDKWKNGTLALINGKKILFKKRIQRPNDCLVSNNGIVVCCDWLNSDELIGKFMIFNNNGELLFSKKTFANLGVCGISNDGKIALFETYDSETDEGNKLFIIDVESKKIIKRIERPSSFNKVTIDANSKRIGLINNRNYIFEIDFDGNQTNKEEYEMQIMVTGSILDKLGLYSLKSDEAKFQDTEYLTLLENALLDQDASYSYGFDRLYRYIGEYYDANDNIIKTIEYWEKAVEINPKVGIKRKLDALKKKK
ncbi:MAG: hypothetical protein P4L34_04865 [Paludibacter sp.]|nr:hypothetical protein [Paludibacter sp.]